MTESKANLIAAIRRKYRGYRGIVLIFDLLRDNNSTEINRAIITILISRGTRKTRNNKTRRSHKSPLYVAGAGVGAVTDPEEEAGAEAGAEAEAEEEAGAEA